PLVLRHLTAPPRSCSRWLRWAIREMVLAPKDRRAYCTYVHARSTEALMTKKEPSQAVVDRQDQEQAAGRMTTLPPGPRWPRAMQTVWWATRPVSLLDRCRRRHGDVFRLRPYGHGDI